MKIISSEQFFDADKEVQDAIMKWWKPEEGDLYCDIADYGINHLGVVLEENEDVINIDKEHGYYIPLLTVGQLVELIESKTGYYLEIKYDESNDFGYIFDLGYASGQHYSKYTDLIKALWELAQKIVIK